MEVLEQEKIKEKYIDLNKYNIDSVLVDSNEPERFRNWDEYIEWKNKNLGEDVVEEYLDLNRFETIPALDRALASGFEPEVCKTLEEYIALMKKWDEEDD